jgi:hypothetical protein
VSLIVTLAVLPFLGKAGWSGKLLLGFLSLNLLAAIFGAVSEESLRTLRALGGLAILVFAALAVFGTGSLLTAGELAGTLVALVALAAIVRTVFRTGPANAERIFGALGAYLLFGVVCGVAYLLLEQGSPGSLSASAGQSAGAFQLPDAMYFSFVTLATLGYGDIVPRTPPAQSMAIAEAILGQLYLVVLVSRLVSLYARSGSE